MSDTKPAWHPEVLPEGWARAADELADRSVLGGFHLSGGTGLALHIGHRRSVDLDLFSSEDFDSSALRDKLRGLPDLRVLQIAPGTLHLEAYSILVSFLHYPYPLLFPLAQFETLAVADPRDIGCTKVLTIASRGSRRDFVDLYVAARRYGLGQLLAWFEAKFSGVHHNRIHLLKALTYFVDAEAQPMPDMLVPIDWQEVTDFFRTEAPRLLR